MTSTRRALHPLAPVAPVAPVTPVAPVALVALPRRTIPAVRWCRVLSIAGLVGLVGLAGCGISSDSRPRALPDDARSLLRVPDTTAADRPPAGTQATLYFLRDNHLVATTRKVAVVPTVEAVFRLLLAGPSEEERQGSGLTSAIPSKVTLRGATKDAAGLLTVDLGPEVATIGGNAAKGAYAQMVLTAKALGIDRVRFLVDGTPTAAPTDDGNKSVVEASNYKPPLNPG